MSLKTAQHVDSQEKPRALVRVRVPREVRKPRPQVCRHLKSLAREPGRKHDRVADPADRSNVPEECQIRVDRPRAPPTQRASSFRHRPLRKGLRQCPAHGPHDRLLSSNSPDVRPCPRSARLMSWLLSSNPLTLEPGWPPTRCASECTGRAQQKPGTAEYQAPLARSSSSLRIEPSLPLDLRKDDRVA